MNIAKSSIRTLGYSLLIIVLLSLMITYAFKKTIRIGQNESLTDTGDIVTATFIKEKIINPLKHNLSGFFRGMPEIKYELVKTDDKDGFIYGHAYEWGANYREEAPEYYERGKVWNFRINVHKDIAEIQDTDKKYKDAKLWNTKSKSSDNPYN